MGQTMGPTTPSKKGYVRPDIVIPRKTKDIFNFLLSVFYSFPRSLARTIKNRELLGTFSIHSK